MLNMKKIRKVIGFGLVAVTTAIPRPLRRRHRHHHHGCDDNLRLVLKIIVWFGFWVQNVILQLKLNTRS